MLGLVDEVRHGVRFTRRAELAVVLNDRVRKCVAFMAARKANRYVIGGTVFLVVHPIEGTGHYDMYAVSARHCVEDCKELSPDTSVNIRFNKCDGAYSYTKTEFHEWRFHPDSRIDVAAYALDWSSEDFSDVYDHLPVMSDWFAVDEFLSVLDVTPGDDLFFPGLFVRHPGEKANIPIIRTGTIAAMPNEPVRTKQGMADVYLAEVRSIGGHSGSPVFMHMNSIEKLGEVRKLSKASGFAFDAAVPPLLGMVHGHFLFRADGATWDDFDATDQINDSFSIERNDFNSGIAIIVPARHILETLNQPDFLQRRERERDRIAKHGDDLPVPD